MSSEKNCKGCNANSILDQALINVLREQVQVQKNMIETLKMQLAESQLKKI